MAQTFLRLKNPTTASSGTIATRLGFSPSVGSSSAYREDNDSPPSASSTGNFFANSFYSKMFGKDFSRLDIAKISLSQSAFRKYEQNQLVVSEAGFGRSGESESESPGKNKNRKIEKSNLSGALVEIELRDSQKKDESALESCWEACFSGYL